MKLADFMIHHNKPIKDMVRCKNGIRMMDYEVPKRCTHHMNREESRLNKYLCTSTQQTIFPRKQLLYIPVVDTKEIQWRIQLNDICGEQNIISCCKIIAASVNIPRT